MNYTQCPDGIDDQLKGNELNARRLARYSDKLRKISVIRQ